ncbi:MAG: histidine kinase [Cytophagales bacterium]|nr:histidine kinase [Cytophagales bacterium]
MFAHRYRYGFVVLIAAYSYVNTLYVEALEYYRIPLAGWEVLALFAFMVTAIWEGNRLFERQVPNLQAWLKRLTGREVHPLLLMLAGSVVLTFLAVAGPTLLLGRYQLGYAWPQMVMPLKLALTLGFRINLFLNTLNAIFFFLRQQREAQIEAERFKKISVQAQYQTLKNQVNPHFLFNNLNVLSTLVYKDPEAASEFIEELAKVYRYVLQNFEKELVELRTEMEFIKSYAYLLEKRFGHSIRIETDVPERFQPYYIVPVALQMLIENAIKHNVSSRSKPLHIRIYVDDTQQLVVQNNLQPKPEKETSTNIGLENISKRYEFVSKQRIAIQRDPEFFTIRMPLLQLSVA